MYLAPRKAHVLSRLFATFAECDDERVLRTLAAPLILDLMQADYFASYVWAGARGFTGCVQLNMNDSNLDTYRDYFQFHDPMTPQLQLRREPTLVTQVIAQAELVKTEFFNDFLFRDGLYWGVNLYAWSEDRNLGDLRIWRGKNKDNFDANDLAILDLVKPAFVAALQRVGSRAAPSMIEDPRHSFALASSLSDREWEIVELLAAGLADKEIAQRLRIGFATVRTHVNSLFNKLGVHNRVKLAGLFRARF